MPESWNFHKRILVKLKSKQSGQKYVKLDFDILTTVHHKNANIAIFYARKLESSLKNPF